MSDTQIAKSESKSDLRSILSSERFKEQVALALPRHCSPDRFARIALSALGRTPKLMECTQQSVLKCFMDLSAFGLEPDGRNAHLIPYGKDCTLIIDWKGLIALAKRNGDVTAWQAFDVCENDVFSWENGAVNHIIDFRKDRGAQQCFYSKVTLKDGTVSYEVMTKAEVDKIRAISKSGNSGPWSSFYGEMAKKTVVRRHSKQLDLSPQVQDAIATGDDDIEERPARGREIKQAVIPLPLPPPKEEIPEFDLGDERLSPCETVTAKMEATGLAWSDIKKWVNDNGGKAGNTPANTDETTLLNILDNWSDIGN